VEISEFIKEQVDNRIEEDAADSTEPKQAFLPYVKAKVLTKAIEFMNLYANEPMKTIPKSVRCQQDETRMAAPKTHSPFIHPRHTETS